jgi:hypothetical protein
VFVVTDENFHRVRVYYATDMQRAINEGLGRLNTANPTPPWGLRGTQHRVIFDHHGNFITVIAHAQALNRNDFYPGHEAEYNGAGNVVLNRPYHAGSNPDYSNHWGLYAALLMHIQHYKAPPGP